MLTSGCWAVSETPGGLGVEAHPHRGLVLGAVGLLHLARPDAPRGAVLGDLLEEVDVRVEEEAEPRGEVVDVQAALDRLLDVGEAVLQRERQLLLGRRTRLANVVPGDRNRVPARHVLGRPFDHVADQAHRRLDREAPLLLGDVLLEDVGLNRPAEAVGRDALLLGRDDVKGQQDRGGRVDGHRDGDLVERDPVEEGLHVVERVQRDALHADFAEAAAVVGVEAHQRGHVEGGREARLPVVEQVVEALVGLLGRSEARELPHRPQPPAVHRRVDAARERVLAGVADVSLGIGLGAVLLGVEGLDLGVRDRREESLALLHLVVDLVQPLVGPAARVRLDCHCRKATAGPRMTLDQRIATNSSCRSPTGIAPVPIPFTSQSWTLSVFAVTVFSAG